MRKSRQRKKRGFPKRHDSLHISALGYDNKRNKLYSPKRKTIAHNGRENGDHDARFAGGIYGRNTRGLSMGIGFNIIVRKLGAEIKKFITLIFEARKGDNRNALLYNSAGEDSVPLNDERLILVKVDGTGKYVAVAVLTQSQGAKPGEKIFFARDADAKTVSKISMLNDGSVSVEADGDISHNTKGDFKAVAEGDMQLSANNMTAEAKEKNTIKGSDVELNGKVKATGGSFQCNGSVAPTGEGALCGCKFCYVTGAPVAGSMAQGT
jgi:hypothetical protein